MLSAANCLAKSKRPCDIGPVGFAAVSIARCVIIWLGLDVCTTIRCITCARAVIIDVAAGDDGTVTFPTKPGLAFTILKAVWLISLFCSGVSSVSTVCAVANVGSV